MPDSGRQNQAWTRPYTDIRWVTVITVRYTVVGRETLY